MSKKPHYYVIPGLYEKQMLRAKYVLNNLCNTVAPDYKVTPAQLIATRMNRDIIEAVSIVCLLAKKADIKDRDLTIYFQRKHQVDIHHYLKTINNRLSVETALQAKVENYMSAMQVTSWF